MADNLTTTTTPATPPAGTVYATDDVGGVHYPRVKITDGTADGNTHAKVDSAGGLSVGGQVAHDAADSGNPVKIGGKAFDGANLTAVADDDRVNTRHDKLGRIVVTPHQTRGHIGRQATTISNTTETTIVTAAASVYHDLLSLTITNASATDVVATLRDSSGGSTVALFAIAANGGITIPFPVGLNQTTVNTAWTLQLGVTVTVYVLAVYAKNI